MNAYEFMEMYFLRLGYVQHRQGDIKTQDAFALLLFVWLQFINNARPLKRCFVSIMEWLKINVWAKIRDVGRHFVKDIDEICGLSSDSHR